MAFESTNTDTSKTGEKYSQNPFYHLDLQSHREVSSPLHNPDDNSDPSILLT